MRRDGKLIFMGYLLLVNLFYIFRSVGFYIKFLSNISYLVVFFVVVNLINLLYLFFEVRVRVFFL